MWEIVFAHPDTLGDFEKKLSHIDKFYIVDNLGTNFAYKK